MHCWGRDGKTGESKHYTILQAGGMIHGRIAATSRTALSHAARRGVATSNVHLFQQQLSRATPFSGFGQRGEAASAGSSAEDGEYGSSSSDAPPTGSFGSGSQAPSYGSGGFTGGNRSFSSPRYAQRALSPAASEGGAGSAGNVATAAYGSNVFAASREASSAQAGSAGASTAPFPEELDQDYSSESLYLGASGEPFSEETCKILQAELSPEEIEIKPDGVIYLPENRYRKILHAAFGAGGWALIPRGAHTLASNVLSREYALFAAGRYITQVRGHASVFGFSNPALASEVVRSNALMRACKDLCVANELWDMNFVERWRSTYAAKRIDNGRVRWQKRDSANGSASSAASYI